MKAKLTPGENYLRLAHGQIPESIPIYTMGFSPKTGEPPVRLIGPSLFNETHTEPAPQGRRDIWGVNYIANAETNYACIPEPGNFILKDITRWRDVIKAPEMPVGIDWDRLAAKDMAACGLDRSQSAAMGVIGLMPFQQFIAFMGFTEGLMAFYEEPEEVAALLNYLADFYVPVVEATVRYYSPDILYLLDDTAASISPFISPEMFRSILLPVYKRLTKPATDRGIPLQLHNCGRCEDFLDDMVNMGVTLWDPAQSTNDLDCLKKKYGRRLAFAGCFSLTAPANWSDLDESYVRQAVRDCIDRYAADGGFSFCGGVMALPGDEGGKTVNGWISDEAYKYCDGYYLR